eukprot:760789-Hanusia_phi.AAC.5
MAWTSRSPLDMLLQQERTSSLTQFVTSTYDVVPVKNRQDVLESKEASELLQVRSCTLVPLSLAVPTCSSGAMTADRTIKRSISARLPPEQIRRMFVDQALSYLGVPYSKGQGNAGNKYSRLLKQVAPVRDMRNALKKRSG